MSESKELLYNLIKESSETVKQGAMWVQGEIPLLIQEILVFNTVLSGMGTLLGLLILCVPLIILYRKIKNFNSLRENYNIALDLWLEGKTPRERFSNLEYRGNGGMPLEPDLGDLMPYYVSCILLSVTGAVVFPVNLVMLLKVTLAPRLYLLEYAAGLL